jgi:response regulator RpfG family c-di-GMP phosphodiesterase
MEKFTDSFINIEKKLKIELARLIEDDPFQSGLSYIVTELDSLVRSNIDSLFLFSISLLHDDIFNICFPKHTNHTKEGLYSFSYLDYGLIGYYCKVSQKDSSKDIHFFKNNAEIATAYQMVQRTIFISNDNIQSFVILPLIINKKIIGAIQLSLKKEIDDKQKIVISDFLSLLSSKIIWILLLEQTRISNIFGIAELLISALESKNNFQADHSKNVADLVTGFIYILSTNDNYKNLIFKDKYLFSGFDIIKLRLSALFHDIGKFTMSDDSFEIPKISEMSDIDRCKRYLHPYFTFKILSQTRVTKDIAAIASMHHEKYNNKGFPWGIPKNKLGIESQLISFADIIDSMARQRPNKDKRDSLGYILTELKSERTKECFSLPVYNALLGIISEFRDSPENSNLSKIPKIKHLLGIYNSKKEFKRTKSKSSFSTLFNSFVKENNQLKQDNWLGLILIQFEEKIDSINIPFSNNEWVKFSNDEIYYYGLYYSKISKELSYDFCTKISGLLPSCKISVIFADNKILKNNTFDSLKLKLEKEIKTMKFEDRWRLLMM